MLESLESEFHFPPVKSFLDNLLVIDKKVITNELNVKTGRRSFKDKNLSTLPDSQGNKSTAKSVNFLSLCT